MNTQRFSVVKRINSLLLPILLIMLALGGHAQTAADSISLTFPKVLAVNDRGEILLAFDKNRNAYEVPGYNFNGPISYKNLMDTAAADMGIRYTSFRMGGTFIYRYPNKYRTFIRPYFVISCSGYTNGDAIKDTAAFKWFKLSDAIEAIPYPASALIVKQILSHPEKNWSATFEEYGYTNPVDRKKIVFKIVEGFYSL